MKTFSPFALLLCLFTTVTAQQQGDPSVLSLSDLHRLSQEWKQAYNNKDATKLIPLYAEEAKYISAHVPGYTARGRDAVIANFQRGAETGGFIDSVDVLSTHFSCDLVMLVTATRVSPGDKKWKGGISSSGRRWRGNGSLLRT